MNIYEYHYVEKKAVWIKWAGWLGFVCSRKMLHNKWLYFIWTDANDLGHALATENELIFLE